MEELPDDIAVRESVTVKENVGEEMALPPVMITKVFEEGTGKMQLHRFLFCV